MRDLPSAIRQSSLPVRRYQRAQVTAVVSANMLKVRLDSGEDVVQLPAVSSSPTYAVNDIVVVARDATGPFVTGRLGVGPGAPETPAPAPVPPPSTVSKRSKTILPSSTGTYRSGWRDGDELRQGDWNTGYGINFGAAFYGRQLSGLGADLDRPRSAVLRYSRLAGGVFGSQSPTVWTLDQNYRPSGAPTRLSSGTATAVAVNRSASWTLPTGMLDELLDGSAGGLGIYVGGSSPYIVLAGRSASSSSMSLAISYYA
jgi:hypothetical protein